jgi:Fe-S-cluster containining protein
MKLKIEKAYKSFSNLFKNIGKVCNRCDTCCRTYGWLLKNEAKKLSKMGYPVVKINNKISCIDSFKRNKNRRIVFEKIPVCRFYKYKRCEIQKNKPLDCRLYPLKLIFEDDKPIWVISLGCKYISSLNEHQMEDLVKKTKIKLEKTPKKVLDEYILLMFDINKISKSKRFWKRRII